MAEAKNTHVANHAIQYRDEKNVYEIAPGSEFNPAALNLDVAHLEGNGAITKIKRAAAVAEQSADDKGAKTK